MRGYIYTYIHLPHPTPMTIPRAPSVSGPPPNPDSAGGPPHPRPNGSVHPPLLARAISIYMYMRTRLGHPKCPRRRGRGLENN